MKLSVIVATHNEAENIGKCLAAVKDIADEILVADGESTDDTVRIARAHGAIVLPMTNKKMFHENKEAARKQARGKWLLFLDADEIVSPELAAEIQRVVDDTYTPAPIGKLFAKHMHILEQREGITFARQPPYHGFFMARKNYFLGGYLMHSGVYPDGVIRLVRAGSGYWPCKDVHETMVVTGGVTWLTHPLLHMSDPTFSRYLTRANRYTSLTAASLREAGVPLTFASAIQYLVWKPLKTFFLLYIRHKGFLDGFAGFVWALMSGLHFSIAYLKYRSRASL